MILVLNAANKAAFPALMDDMFRARHEVFVERKGWEELRRADGRQIDGFDRADAVYLLALGPARVVAGVRLTGCVGPTFAESLLPELFEEPAPRGEDLLEMTRLFARPEAMSPGGGAPAINAVLTATLEFVRTVGARGCLMLSRLELVEALLAWGVRPEPLGLPRRTRDGVLMAVMCPGTVRALAALRSATGVGRPVLWWSAEPEAEPVAFAEVLGADPGSPFWRPPGSLTPLARSALGPTELARMAAGP
ncbi:acyl-homoserine-lactone synthase [Caulobacter mirabilis]|uniref:Acyl-homoserine-lactone synthase n=1 Tax=Caulobacter mirabilis TaxID=69666 RepID=A0A2D2AV88_9CAUL|nr:acyl-homoserine-lactone synthase [Caulobacter mirabilis]ATQ41908.1 hypothetical protein CSW64_05505 [Caulobacter mirabilis]